MEAISAQRASALQAMGRAVVKTEAEALLGLLSRIDEHFITACQFLLACQGRIVVLGLGKSGHVGGKIAATLASTGSPAFFVHAGEASHGDLGMITTKDVVLAISNSGETHELVTILPLIKRLGVPLITLVGSVNSTLAKGADVCLDVSVEKEACPLGLAPTASTTATLAMGDALAVALLEHRGFTAEDFAKSHPGGSLGRRLLLLIDDIMHTGDRIPCVDQFATLEATLIEITSKSLGFVCVADESGQVVGVFTDGDLRRVLGQNVLDIRTTLIREVMVPACKMIGNKALAAEALQLMELHKINALPVVNDQQELIGAINMHDLLRAGVV